MKKNDWEERIGYLKHSPMYAIWRDFDEYVRDLTRLWRIELILFKCIEMIAESGSVRLYMKHELGGTKVPRMNNVQNIERLTILRREIQR